MSKTTETTVEDIQDFLDDLADIPNDFERRSHLITEWPDIPESFWKRLTPSVILRMDAVQFMSVISYMDPTGEDAVHNVMRDAA